MLFRQDGCNGFGYILQGSCVTLDLVHITGFQAGLHIRNCFGGLRLIIDDLLCNAFEIDQHLKDILRDDRKTSRDGEESIENIVGNACIFHRECVKRANRVRQLERDLLDRIDHVLMILDHFANVIQRVGQFI